MSADRPRFENKNLDTRCGIAVTNFVLSLMAIEDRIYPLLKHYIGAPQGVKNLMGAAYSLVPISWRYGSRYAEFMRDIERSDDVEWIRRRADEKLLETLQWAAQTVPAYASMRAEMARDRSPEEHLLAFDLLPKERVKADTAAFLSNSIAPSERLPMHTGGSTSVPMRIYVQKYVSRSKDFAYNGAFDRIAGVRRGDTILAARGRPVRGADKPGGRIWLLDPIKNYLQVSANHLLPQHMPEYVEAMRKYKPGFIHAYPTAIEPLARWLEENPAPDVTGRIRCVQLFSETIHAYQLDLIERVFKCPVILDYGHSERAVKAISMPGDRRYFFWPLYGRVELVSFDGKPVTEPGVLGEIVATGFDNQVMPLIRYRTGDLATWSDRPNHTRPGFPVVDRIEGRLQEFLVCKDRRLVSTTSMCAPHFEVLVTADCMQFEQNEPGRAVLKVLSTNELSAEAKAVLTDGIRAKTQGGLEVEVVRVDDLPRTAAGKHRLLVQKLDAKNYTWGAGAT